MSAKRGQFARWLTGQGIEVGALHHPLDVPAGASVRYVDRLNNEDLRHHYPELAEETLVPVSVIGNAEDLSAVDDCSQDFVIANHLVEHLEYPIRALAEFHRVLKPGGILYMALPDQRCTFDRARQLTSVEHLLEEHRRGNAEQNRRQHYREWVVLSNGIAPGPEAEAATDRLLEMGYSIHFHVWRPDTFLDFLVAARREANLAFSLLGFAAPEDEADNEFILVLAKGYPDKPPILPAQTARGELATAELERRSSKRSWLRGAVAQSPLGPPVRAIRNAGRRLGRGFQV